MPSSPRVDRYPLPTGPVQPWFTAGEDRNQRDAERSGKMQETRVNADDVLCAGNQFCNLVQRCALGHACARHFERYAFAARALDRGTPWQHQFKPRTECLTECDPIGFRPLFFHPRGRVQQHCITRCVIRKACAVEPKVGSALRRVTECQSTQDPVTLDCV